MNQLKKRYYQAELLKIKRGNARGTLINAKPLYLLAIIEAINIGTLSSNIIRYPSQTVEKLYNLMYVIHEPNKKVSPFELPFYHLIGETFYHIRWKGRQYEKSPHSHSPSRRYLRENVDYAYLDTDLWDLLQDPAVREEYKELIIDFYLKANI
jgi:putative restriction endonuclease